MTDLAIYDLDRTLTRRATYTPFLIHCALRRAPWRLLLAPVVLVSMLLYGVRIIDRGRLKEINHQLLLGRWIHPKDLTPLVDSFADATVESAKLSTSGVRSFGWIQRPSSSWWLISFRRPRSMIRRP